MSNAIKGLQSIKSMQHIKTSSIRNKEESEYIKLFLFEKEKNRLKSQEASLLIRLETIQYRVKEIDDYKAEQAEIMASSEHEEKLKNSKKDGENEWETMSIDY